MTSEIVHNVLVAMFVMSVATAVGLILLAVYIDFQIVTLKQTYTDLLGEKEKLSAALKEKDNQCDRLTIELQREKTDRHCLQQNVKALLLQLNDELDPAERIKEI